MELSLQKLVPIERRTGEETQAEKTPSGSTELYERKQLQQRAKWRTLLHGRYAVSAEQVSIFLTSENTVITIFEASGGDVLKPVLRRLNSPQTIVRSSNDPSILVQSVIDVVVDLSLPIGRAVNEIFGELEDAVLSTPTIGQSKQLYVLRSALTLLMDNIIATQGLVKTLIDHRPLSPSSEASGVPSSTASKTHGLSTNVQISPTSQVYLQDVHDHIAALSNSTHMSIRSADNLTSLIFNTIAASQNESVRQLTLVSSFFLPLTFLTGYFGMNFDPMPIVNNNSDIMFWYIAGPVMLGMSAVLGSRAARRRSLPCKRTQMPRERQRSG
ncbi:hypothetical protein LTR37_015798 [Vermiconidia calcicola]|uniref:Uncharacterized protein n=1 Tax=Vermiconidia calcicola TaxID=1690605 RepID=A0ACC3MPN8_9PEZI|nr:hypothetical protein LTR37_015798 [Vermiconidia calcicola]